MKKSIIELTEKEVDGVFGGEWEWLPVLQGVGKGVAAVLIQVGGFVGAFGIITCLSVKRKRAALKE